MLNFKDHKIISESILVVIVVSLLLLQYWHYGRTASEDNALKMIQSRYQSNVLAGEEFTVTVGFKNIGTSIWQKTGDHKVELKIAQPWDRQSLLTSSKWPDSITVATLSSTRNLPGRIAYFVLPLQAPNTPGSLTEKFLLVKNNTEIISGSEFSLEFNIAENPDLKDSTAGSTESVSSVIDPRSRPTGIELPTLETKELTMEEICQTFTLESINVVYFERYLNYCLMGRTIKNSYADNSVNQGDILNDQDYLLWRRNPNK